jgi:hypothetical protein
VSEIESILKTYSNTKYSNKIITIAPKKNTCHAVSNFARAANMATITDNLATVSQLIRKLIILLAKWK